MNELFALDRFGWWHLAGWTMLHYLCLGTFVALAAGLCRLVLRRAPANVRYVAALVCFLLLAVMPAGIAAWLGTNPQVEDPPGRADVLPLQAVEAPLARDVATTQVTPEPDELPTAPVNETPQPKPLPPTVAPPSTAGVPIAVFALETSVRYLPWLWIIGAPLTFVLLTTGIVGAERLRRASHIVDSGPIADAFARLVKSLRIGRRVTVAVCERIAGPVLVGIVRPMILLPPAALSGWSPDEIEMVLLHELAHVRRWDNLVNLVQRIVESMLFFHPAVWLVSSWVRREREACCDAAVVRRTNRPHAYAELLLAFATRSPLPGLAFARHPVRVRIRRILGLEDDPMLVSGKSLAVIMSGLLLAATLVVLNLPTQSQAGESATEDTEDTETSAVDVKFVEGASRFEGEDGITITKVRGTSDTFEPDNTYWIEGTYTLASRDRATLGASVTALVSGEGRSTREKNQSMVVERGSGKFMLRLPMKYRGKPHVSFYPADGGQSFGGVYFGTGDSVLENWSDVYGSDDRSPMERDAAADGGKFPSLEDQKLADLLWRRMAIEVEPISSEEDLERVKTLGYSGGLKVRYGRSNLRAPNEYGEIHFGDILVGLHVWPTMNLQAVADVLNRHDLAELNPLKFYVVRRMDVDEASRGYGGGGYGRMAGTPEKKDTVITGRISVNLDKPPATQAPTSNFPFPLRASQPAIESRTMQAPAERSTPQPSWPAIPGHNGSIHPDADTGGVRLVGNGLVYLVDSDTSRSRNFLDMVSKLRGEFAALLEIWVVDVRLNPEVAEGLGASAPPATVLFRDGKKVLHGGGLFSADRARAVIYDEFGYRAPADPAPDQAALRYDGRTFDEWRDQLRDELSTNKRREAVWALAAFGASGHGPQVTEAILEVARQYDWGSTGDSPVGNLKQAMIQALAGSPDGAVHVPAKDWMPILTNELRSGDERIASVAIKLMYYLMQNPPTLSKNEVPTLVEWSVDPAMDPRVRNMAFYTLGMRYIVSPNSDDRVTDRLTQGLLDKDTVALAIEALYGKNVGGGSGRLPETSERPPIEYRPELIEAFLQGSPDVQNAVVVILGELGTKAEPAVPRLLSVVLADGSPNLTSVISAIQAIEGEASNDAIRDYLQGVISQSEPAHSPEEIARAAAILKKLSSLPPQ